MTIVVCTKEALGLVVVLGAFLVGMIANSLRLSSIADQMQLALLMACRDEDKTEGGGPPP